MSNIAFVFPGQGSQSVGMGRALAERSRAARAVFATVDDSLGERISAIAWSGPAEALDRTENAQPALLAASIAYLAALRERWTALGIPEPQPAFYAGHSMGQYSAMIAAGVLSLADGAHLVRERGRQMQASGAGREGRMAAIIGLDDERVAILVARSGQLGVIGVANRNSPGQVVVSGERAAVEEAVSLARGLGAKRAIELPVSVAAHSPLMADAADGMRSVLAAVEFADPNAPLLANRDGHLLVTGEAARAELVDHLTTGVDWVGAVEAMTNAGVRIFVEIGPGRVLTGLIKRIVPDVDAIATDIPGAPDGLAIPTAEVLV